ncbi:LIC_13387 family protein [Aureivirga sp. CE67]|uniref:LIC_13387 family protein n=1 Tax=Aureivirga sp. CE67 TaxID=1788983 RepID=UPI0018C9F021|nr:hypothetical protein [Aureivirga sp. CE67]
MTNKTFQKIAGITMILTGSGHLITHFIFELSENPFPELRALMEGSISELGSNISVLDFHNGFSLTMGILLLAFGIHILRSKTKNDLLIQSILGGIILTIALLYFPEFVIALLSISFISLLISIFKTKEIQHT